MDGMVWQEKGKESKSRSKEVCKEREWYEMIRLEHATINRDGRRRVLRDSRRRAGPRFLARPRVQVTALTGSLAKTIARAGTGFIVREDALFPPKAGSWRCNPRRVVLVALEGTQDCLGCCAAATAGVHWG